jgi:hypothetical protein
MVVILDIITKMHNVSGKPVTYLCMSYLSLKWTYCSNLSSFVEKKNVDLLGL